MPEFIETERLKLIACDPEILKAAIEGNKKLSEKRGVNIAENWTEFGLTALQYSLDKLSQNADEAGWCSYFPIHKNHNTLIGSCGYKGKPDMNGTVEIGYEIAPGYRNKGFATELAKALISNALKHNNVSVIQAHTLAEENASVKVLTKCGFQKVEEIIDPDDGLIWKWQLKKPL